MKNNITLSIILLALWSNSQLLNAKELLIMGEVFGDNNIKLSYVSYLNPKKGEFTMVLFIDGNSTETYCQSENTKGKNVFATKSIDDNVKNIRLEIQSPGFKKYSLNFPNINSLSSPVILDIKKVILKSSNLPKVVQVIHSIDGSRNNHFTLYFHNTTKTEFLITNSEIDAYIIKPSQGCCCPPNSIFLLSDELVVKSGVVNSSFKNLAVNSENYIKVNGNIEVNGCNGSEYFKLNLPSSFKLPPNEFIAIELILPEKFKITDAFFGARGEKWDKYADSKPNSESIDNGKTIRFNYYKFRFTTSLNNELEIDATYSIE